MKKCNHYSLSNFRSAALPPGQLNKIVGGKTLTDHLSVETSTSPSVIGTSDIVDQGKRLPYPDPPAPGNKGIQVNTLSFAGISG